MEAAIGAPSMESRSPGPRVRRALWSMVVLLVLIGAAVVVRCALGKAFRHVRRREVALPRESMIRAFSIGLAVATIRPIIGIFFATRRISGLTPYEFFGTAFWIGFVLHLIAAEVWIQWT